MITYNFSLIGQNGDAINAGTLFLNNDNTKIALAEEVNGVSFMELSETNIKDKDNFIAAVIRRFDKSNVYTAVRAGRPKKDTPILRKDTSVPTERVYVMERDKLPIMVIRDEVIILQNIHNEDVQLHPERLGFKPVDVPVDLEYTKHPVLNAIYARAAIPADFDRALSKTIMKQVAKLRHADKKDWQFVVNYRMPKAVMSVLRERKHGCIVITERYVNALEREYGVTL